MTKNYVLNRIFYVFFLLPSIVLAQWKQIGEDIDAEGSTNFLGRSVSLSSDGSIMAVGAPFNSNGNGIRSGHVRVYRNIAGTWVQIGADIDGEATDDFSGSSVSLSSDGSIVAIGAMLNDGNGTDSGHVRVYENLGGNWTQIGSDIDGEAAQDGTIGVMVNLSSDGSVLAIGAPYNSGNGFASGHVRVYENIGGTWIQIGADIDGEATGDRLGQSVSLSADGTTLAIGAFERDGFGTDPGYVRVYKNMSGVWTQIGTDIDGEASDDQSGWSVSLSSDGSIVAIGAVGNDGNGSASGHVRVYENLGGNWTQIGVDIDGEAAGDEFGFSVSLSDDGSIIAIGARSNDGNGSDSGHVRVYEYVGGVWTQIGVDVDGEASGDGSGFSVSLSADGTIVAIGAPGNQGVASNSGHIRVYSTTVVEWTGATNSDWNTASNWSTNTVPSITNAVIIPSGITNYPTAANTVTVASVDIANNASLIAQNTFTGSVTYNRNLPTSNWYLMSSPVIGQDIDDFVTASGLASGTGTNIGLGTYNTTNNTWSYYQLGTSNTDKLLLAKGYSVNLNNASGSLSFTGSLNTNNTTFSLETTGSGFNLVGNPYTAYLDSNAMLAASTTALTSQTLWLWDATANGGAGAYITKVAADNFKIAPGQGFFVQSNGSVGNIIMNTSFQSHQTTNTFLRGGLRPELHVRLQDGTNDLVTKVYFMEGTTKGFDNGFDGATFTGIEHKVGVYTHLLENDKGVAYAVQSLPKTALESSVIPLGINALSNTELVISVAGQALPSGSNIYLEDKVTNTFTKLDENSKYTVKLNKPVSGVGRFYIHISAKVLSTPDEIESSKVSMYVTSGRKLQIRGLYTSGSVKAFTIEGKLVYESKVEGNGNTTLALPESLGTGLYIIQLNGATVNTSKKVILK